MAAVAVFLNFTVKRSLVQMKFSTNVPPTKIKTSNVIWTFIWCIFMGVTVGSIGLGAAFPSLNLIAKPFVCPTGDMQLSTQSYQPTPVENVTTISWYCVDSKTGTQTELGVFPMSLYAGALYGLLLFVVVFAFMLISAGRRTSTSDDFTRAGSAGISMPYIDKTAERTTRLEKRLVELKKLRDSNLISDDEFKKKRTEILEDL